LIFFQKGGAFLKNVASVVAFKAVDRNGKPIDITGKVFDSDNELITDFPSVHDGMGKFQMIPIEGKQYYTKIKTITGPEIRVELPIAIKQGYLLSFKKFKEKNIVAISTNQETLSKNPNAKLTVVCKARGVTYFETTQTVSETLVSFELPKDKTPDGISQITLYDSDLKPQSERLVYVEKEHDLEVQLNLDKVSFKPNEKTAINVTSKSITGAGKLASFSVSVTDMNGIEDDKDYGTNICSYFLMESDIRGKVYNPGYYFDPNNAKRLEHLDNLLLTQGWRDFIWKSIPKVSETKQYKAEKGITISGRVKQIRTDKPLVNNNLTLSLMRKMNNGIFNATTDSNGLFKFENLLYSGKANMYLSTRDEKGKFKGKIVLDSIEHSPMRISFKKGLINWQEQTRIIAENVFKKYADFDVKSENILDGVAIKAKKKDRSFIVESISQNTGKVPSRFPAFNYTADKDLDISSLTSIFDLILKKMPNIKAFGNSVSFSRYESPPLFTLNSYKDNPNVVSIEQLASISPLDVEYILAVDDIQGENWFNGEEAPYGIILIWTKPFTGNQYTKNPLSSISKRVEGFYNTRAFYSPGLENSNAVLDPKEVIRNTIYWNPYVHPDKTGNVDISYYNTSVETKVKVALEGITGNGIPVVKSVYYIIKK